MAEAVGLISAGVGIAGFAIQVTQTLGTIRDRRAAKGQFDTDLATTIQVLESLQQILENFNSAGQEDSMSQMMRISHRMYMDLERDLKTLLDKLPSENDMKKTRLKWFKNSSRPSAILKSQLRDLNSRLYSYIIFLSAGISFSTNQMLHQSRDSNKEEKNCQRERLANKPQTSIVSPMHFRLPSNRMHQCDCSCHLSKTISSKHWWFEYTPFSVIFSQCSNYSCFRKHRWSLRLTLSNYGIMWAFVGALELAWQQNGITIRPVLSTQRVVANISPGFKALFLCQHGFVSVNEVKDTLLALQKEDPTFKHHVNPAGAKYIEFLVGGCPWLARNDQFDLIDFFVQKLEFTLEDYDHRFLENCAQWIGEGAHMDLLDLILEYGFDPLSIETPNPEKWPIPCSSDWYSPEFAPDPFFLQYIAKLIRGYGGGLEMSPLHSALLTGDQHSVRFWLSRTHNIDYNKNFIGQTPLHLSIMDPEHFNIILSAVEDVDLLDHWGLTPLMYAAGVGSVDIAKCLIKRGANPFLRSAYKDTFITIAYRRGHWNLVVEILLYCKKRLSTKYFQSLVEHALCSFEFCSISATLKETQTNTHLRRLLSFCEDINFQVFNLRLFHRIRTLKQAEILVELGFSLFDQSADDGGLLLHSLARNNELSLFEFCLKRTHKVDQVDKNGDTVLSILAKKLQPTAYNREIRRLIHSCIAAGANIFRTDECRCHCSPKGCSYASNFNPSFDSRKDTWARLLLVSPSDVASFLEWADIMYYHSGPSAAYNFILSCIQRLKFDALDMTHVCCHRGQNNTYDTRRSAELDKEDVDEILDEESEFIKILEEEMSLLRSSTQLPEELIYAWAVLFMQGYDINDEEITTSKKTRPCDNNNEWHFKIDTCNDRIEILYNYEHLFSDNSPTKVNYISSYYRYLEDEQQDLVSSTEKHKEDSCKRRMSWLHIIMEAMDVDLADVKNEVKEMRNRENSCGMT